MFKIKQRKSLNKSGCLATITINQPSSSETKKKGKGKAKAKKGEEEEEEPGAGDDERGRKVQRVGHARLAHDDRARDADAEEDVEHRAAEAGGEAHDGREDGDGHVRDEVGERVPDREDGDADDGVREPKDEPEGLCV